MTGADASEGAYVANEWLMRFKLAFLATVLMAQPASAQIVVHDPNLQLTSHATGLQNPLALAWLGPDDMLVAQRNTGRVRRVINGVLQPASVWEIPGAASGDEFLLGLTINSESPPAVFLFVEDQTGIAGNRVERHRWDPQSGTLVDGETIVAIPPSGAAANADDGGYLQLGPPVVTGDPAVVGDGRTLYIAVGYMQKTGQLRNDPAGSPPDDTGVIMALLQNGEPLPSNPFVPYCSATPSQTCSDDGDCPGAETCTTSVARYHGYGIRNIFGMDIEPITGALWTQENGEDEWDEINRVEAAMNSGWVSIMGPHPGGSPTLFDMPGGASLYQDPIYSWFNTTGPTGIAFAYGSSFGAAYDDSLLVADFNLPGQIYAFPLDGSRLAFDVADNTAETQLELDQFAIATGFAGRPVATEFGPDGHLYVLSYFDGTIYRIEGPGPSNPVPTSWSPLPLALVLLVSASLVLTNRARRSA